MLIELMFQYALSTKRVYLLLYISCLLFFCRQYTTVMCTSTAAWE
jgi:hypothetical protein